MSQTRKKKLEAGLDGLFSKPGPAVSEPANGSTPSPTPALAPAPAEPSAAAAPKQTVRHTAAEAALGREEQVVVFTVADEYYAVEIGAVESIIRFQEITVVPRAPMCIEGVTNLRGLVLPVIDLRTRFGMPRVERTKDTRIVVVEVNDIIVGLVVDAVTEVLRIPEKAIEPPSPLMLSVDSAFIRGIGKVDGRLIILLDLNKAMVLQDIQPA
jgi:purine-binding chemotaxis protein CheW